MGRQTQQGGDCRQWYTTDYNSQRHIEDGERDKPGPSERLGREQGHEQQRRRRRSSDDLSLSNYMGEAWAVVGWA